MIDLKAMQPEPMQNNSDDSEDVTFKSQFAVANFLRVEFLLILWTRASSKRK